MSKDPQTGAAGGQGAAGVVRYGFDPAMAGRRAECDGGSVDAEGRASREEFAGRLTGEYFEQGDPPWRWYLMTDLTQRPPYFEHESVWCDAGFLFVMD
ncbi:MAG: hypothetical protein ACRDJE_18260 [Dehalococcoidia bacterium]